MKVAFALRRFAGFSMVELLVVVGIVVVLAGLLLAAMPGITSAINRNKARAFLAELEGGLSAYQVDHGIYPLNDPAGGDRDRAGVLGAAVLYRHLSGDFDLDGEVDFDKGEMIYVPRLDYASNLGADEPRSTAMGAGAKMFGSLSPTGAFLVIDSYRNPVRYLAQPPNLPPGRDRETRNPSYDLWSVTDADPKASRDEARYLTNWGGL